MKAVQIALQSAVDRVAAFKREVSRLGAKKFPMKSANDLLRVIAARVDEIAVDIADVGEGAWDDEDDQCLTLQGLSSPVLFLHQLLHYLDKVDSPRLPFELLEAFELLASELTGSPAKILLKPDRHYNYYTLMLQDFAREGWAASARKVAEALPELVIVGFPSAEADSTLLHTLLFHEIGHVIYRQQLAKSVSDILQRQVAKQPTAPDGKAFEILANWIEEVCCDLIALRLVGPPFWFAFQWYTVALLERAAPNESHPGIALRAEIMSAYHEHLCGTLPQFAKVANSFDLGQRLPTLPSKASAGPANAAMATATIGDASFREELFAGINEKVKCPFAGVDDLAELVTAGCRDAAEFIPPGSSLSNERMRSLSAAEMLAVVFGAVWQFRVKDYSNWDKFKDWDAEKKARILSELTLAAVEGTSLVRRYAQRPSKVA